MVELVQLVVLKVTLGFSLFCRWAPSYGDSSRNEWSDHWLGKWIISLHRDLVGKHGGVFLTGTVGKEEFLEMGVSLCRVSLGTWGGGTFTGNYER
jgi:hypothetical protein